MKAVWEWYIPKNAKADKTSVFNRAAYSVRPFWHFIFIVLKQFGFAKTLDESWAMRDFFFGIRNVQEANMARVVSTFTNEFEQISIEEANQWLQVIIVSVVSIIHFLIMLITL
jgi:hypothetical protein